MSMTDGFTGTQVKELLALKTVALPPAARPPPSRMILLHSYVATHGTGCALSKARVGAFSTTERDKFTVELYRKLTADRHTKDDLLAEEGRIIYKRAVSADGKAGGKLMKWLEEFPACACRAALTPSPDAGMLHTLIHMQVQIPTFASLPLSLRQVCSRSTPSVRPSSPSRRAHGSGPRARSPRLRVAWAYQASSRRRSCRECPTSPRTHGVRHLPRSPPPSMTFSHLAEDPWSASSPQISSTFHDLL